MLGYKKSGTIQKNTRTVYNILNRSATPYNPNKKFTKYKPTQTPKKVPPKKPNPFDVKVKRDRGYDEEDLAQELLGMGLDDVDNDSDHEDKDDYADELDDITSAVEELGISNSQETHSKDSDKGSTGIRSKLPSTDQKPLAQGEPNKITGIYDSKQNIANRKQLELFNYQYDNVYNFEDFQLFKKVTYDPETFDLTQSIRFFLLHSSWSYSDEWGTTLEFGGNIEDNNASIHVSVTGFKSNFYVKKRPEWTEYHIKAFVDSLNYAVTKLYNWSKFDQKIVGGFAVVFVGYEVGIYSELKDYTSEEKVEMIKIYSLWPRAVAAARKILNEPHKYTWQFSNYTFNVYEADIDYTQRFFLDTQFQPSKWYEIGAMNYEIISYGTTSTASLVVKCNYTDLVMLDLPEYKLKTPNWSILSYDTEWKNIPRRFVTLEEDPIIVITLNAYRFQNPEKRESILMVYARDGLLPEDIPEVDHFYWYRSEPGLLNAFKKFLEYTDVDILIDYNGADFDLRVIGDAGRMYFGKVYMSLGRDLRKPMRFQKSEWRSKISYSVDIYERITIDMLKTVRGTILPGKSFRGFNLGHVSDVLLGETKIEFDPNLMDQKWKNIRTIGEIWKYGDRDALLPGKIADKLNTINISTGTSQMTGLTFQKILNRGSGSKIEGFLRKLCITSDGFTKILLECMNKSDSGNSNLKDTCAKNVIGATVIDPIRGYYDVFVIVFDFNAEYPSIIQLLNLCLSTYVSNIAKANGLVDPEKYFTMPTFVYGDGKIRFNVDQKNPSFVHKSVKEGILPMAERLLGDWRSSVKEELKVIEQRIAEIKHELSEKKAALETLKELQDTHDLGLKAMAKAKIAELELQISTLTFQALVYDGIQAAIKILMNAIFGQTIFEMSRFFKKEVGSTILQFGKYMLNYVKLFLETTVTRANGWSFDAQIIYGDTDSVLMRFLNMMKELTFQEAVQIGKALEVLINDNYKDCKPVRMLFEKIYLRFLMITAKNYIGLKCKGMDNDTDVVIDTKGAKHKKNGTSPLAQKLGKALEETIFMHNDKDKALQLVRDTLIALKKRKVTRSDLVITVNVGKDITAAIYQYMQLQIQAKHPPPKATEESIRARYATLPVSEKSKSAMATITVVYAYKQLCKDPSAWVNRGMTINYIVVDGIESTKRDLVAPVDECVELDLPYNVNFYTEEVTRICRKILAYVVKDTNLKYTPIYDSLTFKHESVLRTVTSQHISFFDSRFGTRTIKINKNNIPEIKEKTDHNTCNRVIARLIDRYESQLQYSQRQTMNSFFSYKFEKCALCSNELHPSEDLVCTICRSNYSELLSVQRDKRNEYKQEMEKAWDVCKNCLKSDIMDPMDCVNITCKNYTKRIDMTKEYYISYQKLGAIVKMEQQKQIQRATEVNDW